MELECVEIEEISERGCWRMEVEEGGEDGVSMLVCFDNDGESLSNTRAIKVHVDVCLLLLVFCMGRGALHHLARKSCKEQGTAPPTTSF